MTSSNDPIPTDEERFIPLADFEHMKEQFFEERERKLRALDERDQLRDALAQVNSGIVKASETLSESIDRLDGSIIVRVETWRRCREMAMDLLHIPVGIDDVQLLLKLEKGNLIGLQQKK